MTCGRTISEGEQIYRHVDNVVCSNCHKKSAAQLVPYPVATAFINTTCGATVAEYHCLATMTQVESEKTPCQFVC